MVLSYNYLIYNSNINIKLQHNNNKINSICSKNITVLDPLYGLNISIKRQLSLYN